MTGDMFVTLCKDITDGKLEENTVTGSKVLLDYLFSTEEAKHHKFHENPNLLGTISQISFVCPGVVHAVYVCVASHSYE